MVADEKTPLDERLLALLKLLNQPPVSLEDMEAMEPSLKKIPTKAQFEASMKENLPNASPCSENILWELHRTGASSETYCKSFPSRTSWSDCWQSRVIKHCANMLMYYL